MSSIKKISTTSKTTTESSEKKILTKEEQEIADTFQMKTGIEHVLLVPDTYIGSIAKTSKDLHIFDDSTNKIIEKNIEYIPGLYKLFDEVLVNARDHIIRMERLIKSGDESAKPVKNIYINVDDDGKITVMNDGNGIPVVMHPEHNIWIPELIFANLRSGANFKDKGNASLNENDDIIGGKNGYGVKLAFIWSIIGSVETVDAQRGLLYKQEINNNMYDIKPPIIQKVLKTTKPYTKVSFLPDFTRFGIPEGLTPDVRALFKKRAYDIAAISDKTVKVYYNNELIPIKSFQQYVDYFVGDKSETIRIYEESNERWEYSVALSPNGEFQHVSFVNGINTNKGGTHVNYVLDNIVSKLRALILQKKKIDVKATTIKEQLILFLRCDIVRPSFDSQSKEYMNTNAKDFGSKCVVSDKFIEKLSKIGIVETACAITDAKEKKQIAKNTDGVKKRTITGIKKLYDAEYAGTSKSASTVLILCEGESAKSAILSGLTALTEEESKRFGVYSLKGKLINVRDELVQKIAANNEICELKEIIGLKMGETYTQENIIQLRYGKIVLLCDSDVDGSHIKGLCINFFNSQWPSLCKLEGFLSFMNTPILKASKGHNTHLFYNMGQFNTWKKEHNDTYHTWNIKYYKGLGTSSKKEWMEYFQNKKFVDYIYNGTYTEDKIDMVFNKKRSDERKNWLATYNPSLYLNTNDSKVTYDDFIQQELIHFSNYDNMRSIPNLMDGFKPSLRKIIYSCFKRNLIEEVKVSQLSGYVSEHSEYHHGEKSLNEAIIGLAQNFIGSNNINLLEPNGAFGSRILGGKDHASERYIFTRLEKITRTIFPKLDDPVLQYLEEDGKSIEPIYYVPILPMILINGSSGIGTGYSTDIPCFNPKDIITYIRNKLNGIKNDPEFEFIPYYEEFKGIIKKIKDNQFSIKGCYEKINDNTIVVTELPVGLWTQDFKEHIEDIINTSDASLVSLTSVKKKSAPKKDESGSGSNADNKSKKTTTTASSKREPIITDFKFKPSDVDICFTITFNKDILSKLESQTPSEDSNGIHKLLKLNTTISTTNMYMYDSKESLKKYLNVKDIIDEFYDVRLEYYEKRRNYRINQLEHELMIISNKVRFILENIDGTIVLKHKTIHEINELLKNKKYNQLNDSYDYLTNMKLISLSKEKVDELLKEKNNKENELNYIKTTSNNTIWLNELDAFENEYDQHVHNRKKLHASIKPDEPLPSKKKSKK